MNNDFKIWLINHIENNPNISFGSLHRDACYSNIKYNSHDGSLIKTLNILLSENIIREIRKNHDSFFISVQKIRDNKLKELLNGNNN